MKRLAIFLLAIAVAAPAFAWGSKKDKEIDAWVATLPPPNTDFGKYPEDYESIVKSYFASRLKDPDSAKYSNFRIKQGYKIVDAPNMVAKFGYVVCVDINAKNSYGAFTGNTLAWLLIRDDNVVAGAMSGSSDFTEKVTFLSAMKHGGCTQ